MRDGFAVGAAGAGAQGDRGEAVEDALDFAVPTGEV